MHLLALMLALVSGSAAHGFDYQFGTWNVHVRRLTRDAAGTSKWVTYDGTHTVTPLWNGRANIGVLSIHGKTGVTRTLSTKRSSTSYNDIISRSYDRGKTWTPVWIAAYKKAAAPPAAHDGARDFDFNVGVWHTRIRRLLHPLTGSNVWTTYDGTVGVRPALHGTANVEEVEATGPTGHLQLLSVRLYNATSHQWSLNDANSRDGVLQAPAMFGQFTNGSGTFYDQESYDGRIILDRQRFFDITPRSYTFEQSFSDDGGKTWEPNFIAHVTRTAAVAPSERSENAANRSHDFDFSYGTWSTKIMSYDTSGPKAGSATAYTGTVSWRKLWGGRAFLEELKASNAGGGFEGLTLFLYNPKSHQWSQTFAAGGAGAFDPSMIGTFKNGRGELVSFPVSDGGTFVLAREIWSQIRPDSHHFEIQYSRDGGKTWQRSFVANLTRIGPGL